MNLLFRRLFNQSVQTMQRSYTQQKAFTLIELLVVIVILLAISYLVVIIVNPVEETRKSRDTIRLSDMESIFRAVNIVINSAGEPSVDLLCVETNSPCLGHSHDPDPLIGNSDGRGWVKVALNTITGVNFAHLPLDPKNDTNFHYSYSSNGAGFEINAIFESEAYKHKMLEDGGNNDNKYELGTSLNLIN
jgi:prepilin-type N-terminal cleavage/methylation domain-containing protein